MKGLVFSGGGIKMLSYPGALHYFEDNNELDQLTVCSGSSGGAMAALMVLLGYTSKEMLDEFDGIDLENMVGGGRITSLQNLPKTLYNSFSQFGISDGIKLEKFIKDIIHKKTGSETTTFDELHTQFGKDLIVTGTCLNTHTTQYFDRNNTPNFPIYKAMRITMSLPPIFTPVVITVRREEFIEKWYTADSELLCQRETFSDHLPGINEFELWYTDGGLLCNYPIEYTYNFMETDSIIIGFDIYHDDLAYRNIDAYWPWDYLKNIIYSQFSELKRISRNCEEYHGTTIPLYITDPDLDIYNFQISSGQLQQLYNDGYRSVKSFYQHQDTDSEESDEQYLNINILINN